MFEGLFRLFRTANNRHAQDAEPVRSYRISPKGLALIAAVESGLLPETEKDGVTGYDDRLFSKFWELLCEDLDIRFKPEVVNRGC